jgi:DNA-binding Lrp family transcriptional regulator
MTHRLLGQPPLRRLWSQTRPDRQDVQYLRQIAGPNVQSIQHLTASAVQPAGDTVTVDALDARLIALLAAHPRLGVVECSRRLGVARGTAQARLDRLAERGIVRGFGPEVDPARLGYGVTAFLTLEIRQARGHDPVAERLAGIPEVLEVHTITGAGDLLCRVVARSNHDLQRVIDAVVDVEGVMRTSTTIALSDPVPYRVLPLVAHAARGAH